MYKAWYPRDDVGRLYVSRKEEERGLSSIEDSVEASIQWLEAYTEKRGGRMNTVTRNNTNNTGISRTTITRKQKWEEKQFYGSFKRLKINISHEKT